MNYKDLFNTNTHLLVETEVKELLVIAEYWQKRCFLAEKIIEETPCVLGITINEIEAWNKYQEFMKDNTLNK